MAEWAPEPTTSSWQILPNVGDTPFKRRRLRHDDRVRQVMEHIRRHDYVVLLGPAYSEKSRLLDDVEEQLAANDLFAPIYVNLWRVRTDDEAAFFSSFAQMICRAEALSGLPYPDMALAERTYDAAGFRFFLDTLVQRHDRHLVLLIDHLQVLPQDLIHRLLQLLRAAYMERSPTAQHQLDVVVTGSAVLAELAHDSTSPFNMAHGVFQGPLAPDASLALARANLAAGTTPFSEGAVERCVYWGGGDSYLIPLLVSLCGDKIHGYRRQYITHTVVDRTAEAFLAAGECEPIRAAIQVIEEDPDTVLDIVALLRAGELPRNEAHQKILRTGLDRLQLSGAVVLVGDAYRIKNEIYHRVLRRHFVQARVAHVLRMNGRWGEAIQYLSAQLESSPHAAEEIEASRTDLLEAVIQSIYAADREQDAYEALLEGIHLGFHISGVRIYRAYPGRGELRLVESDGDEVFAEEVIDLNNGDLPEVRTFRGGDFALRGDVGSKRLLAALTPERRAIGMVTIDRYSSETEPHVYPPGMFALLRFLRHASGAIENVVMRSAVQEIGRAVLDASTLTSNLDRVLQVVLNATGGDAAQLHLLDVERKELRRVVHTGATGARHAAGEAVIELAMTNHGAVQALRNNALTPVRQIPPPGTFAYLPLVAGGRPLGVLTLFFDIQGGGFSFEERKTLTTFADQVAIAVHNMQLLRQTDEALQEKVRELEVERRKAVQERDQELQEVAYALVHRIGNVTGDLPVRLEQLRNAITTSGGEPGEARTRTLAAVEHMTRRVQRLKDLLPPLREIANLASVAFRPVELAGLVAEVVYELLPAMGPIQSHLESSGELVVEGSRSLLRDALRSLLENAYEAMPNGGTLTVRVAKTDGQARIEIEDTGVGISPQQMVHMFQLGFTTKGVNGKGETGRDANRGLGMFTCRAVVRKHGGEIDVASELGKGTVVTVALPLLSG